MKLYKIIWIIYDQCNFSGFAFFPTKKEALQYLKESKLENKKWHEEKAYLSGPYKYILADNCVQNNNSVQNNDIRTGRYYD